MWTRRVPHRAANDGRPGFDGTLCGDLGKNVMACRLNGGAPIRRGASKPARPRSAAATRPPSAPPPAGSATVSGPKRRAPFHRPPPARRRRRRPLRRRHGREPGRRKTDSRVWRKAPLIPTADAGHAASAAGCSASDATAWSASCATPRSRGSTSGRTASGARRSPALSPGWPGRGGPGPRRTRPGETRRPKPPGNASAARAVEPIRHYRRRLDGSAQRSAPKGVHTGAHPCKGCRRSPVHVSARRRQRHRPKRTQAPARTGRRLRARSPRRDDPRRQPGDAPCHTLPDRRDIAPAGPTGTVVAQGS